MLAKNTLMGLALAVGSMLAFAPRAHATTKHKAKHRHPVFTGWLVPKSQIRTEPFEKPSGHLKLYNVNFRESLEVDLYNPDGTMSDDALDKLNHFWRCKRTGTEKPINPHLFEVLSAIEDHFDGKQLELVSGFRNQEHQTSRHFEGNASDVRMPGVSDKELHAFVASIDNGHQGLGLYPKAGFIHVDVRDESFRWIDYSPAGSSHPSGKRAKHANNT